MRECSAQPAALVAPSWVIISSYLCVTDTNQLHTRTAAWTHAAVIHCVSDTRNGYGMRECDAQPIALVAPCRILINSYLCVTDTFKQHMITAGWTQGR